ncbi:CTP synthase [Bifidobacterium sp. LC6]|uniref:CTP synthase n=1 Tax=Bifidobacterium colobi TaxID=2809026 RepID=A0ABS5UVJ2_9BIFI|nr:CTP synthase [Bifidobacterium colobi]MBT1174722.1 CTP synthase [Bifidobacterium colobi]
MKTHHRIEQLCNDAEQKRRCFYHTNDSERHAARTRVQRGLLVRPHRNVYARQAYWNSLNPAEQCRHVIRTLSTQYPNRTFAGISAAAMLNLEYSWSLNREGTIFLASSSGNSVRTHSSIQHVIIRRPPTHNVVHYLFNQQFCTLLMPANAPNTADSIMTNLPQNAILTNIVPVTSPARTLVDCGLQYPFVQAMAMFDSALRQGIVTREQVMEICDSLQKDCGPVLRLLRYTNPLNENGGESLCYATIIDEGFAVPELQHVFIAPQSPQGTFRVDFVWHTEDGRVIVLEFDGTEKYVDPAMTDNHSVQRVVNDERQREDFLKQAGVTAIIRVNYNEVRQRNPLVRKLLEAHVPMARAHPFYERYTDVQGRVW